MQRYQHNYEIAEEAKKSLENQIRGYADTLNKKIQEIHELELKINKIDGENCLVKNRYERMTEENSELKRKIGQKDD